jgi:hypothetical protein
MTASLKDLKNLLLAESRRARTPPTPRDEGWPEDPERVLKALALLGMVERGTHAVVPREPTEAMLANGREALMPIHRLSSYGPLVGIWNDMLHASPSPFLGPKPAADEPKP